MIKGRKDENKQIQLLHISWSIIIMIKLFN